MPASLRINTTTGNYTVKIQRGLTGRLGIETLRLCEDVYNEIALITDENISSLYLQRVITNFQECPRPEGMRLRICELLIKPDQPITKLFDDMAGLGLSDKCCVIALGGMSVCSSAAFASGCYMHGVKIIFVPTTLRAMIESSVGGRADLNLTSGYHMAGITHQPALVLCDPDCLSTLPEHEYKSGVAEALSIAIMTGSEILRLFLNESDLRVNIDRVIDACIKFRIECFDESGNKRFQNTARAIGNAIERFSGGRITHDLAISQGAAITAKAGAKLKIFSENISARIINALKYNKLPFSYMGDLSAEIISREIMRASKAHDNSIKFALPIDNGNYILREMDSHELESFIYAGITA